VRIVLAPDLHMTAGLDAEIEAAAHRLPPRFYAHVRPGGAYWHNRMMFDEVATLAGRLASLCSEVKADLCVFLGDLVNIDTPANMEALSRALAGWPCPARWLLGNHDVYLGPGGAGIAAAVGRTGERPGLRLERLDGFALMCLDDWLRHGDGTFDHSYVPGERGHSVACRESDVGEAAAALDAEPALPVLLLTHMPLVEPPRELARPGRKLAAPDPALAPLRDRLAARGGLAAICGHGHYNALSTPGAGLHWALPSIIEYPCTAAVCDVDGRGLKAKLVPLDEGVASRSLAGQAWTAGGPGEQAVARSWPQPRGRRSTP
jgi:hypothetical protein